MPARSSTAEAEASREGVIDLIMMTGEAHVPGSVPPVTDPHGRLHAAIAELAAYNDDPGAGGITREVYTPTYAAALERVTAWMRDAGLEVRLDAVGNLFGRWPGSDPDAARVLTGSHVDTTLNAGAYDGVLGVLGAIEAVHALRERGFVPRRPIEVVAWAGEEPRFGTGCVGSRAAAGEVTREDLDRLRDRDGVTMAEALAGAGFHPDRVADARIDPATVHALVELHIEQGVVLETHGEPIGVVTAIAAPHDFRLTFTGAATHAGATPMDLRRDALVGSAEAVVAVERIARASSSGTTVGTVGVVRARPGAINVVPGTVELDVDVRDTDLAAREDVVTGIVAAARAIGAGRGLEVAVDEIVEDVPVACDPEVVSAAQGACAELRLTPRTMTSGAYHDAMIMGRRVPVGMIFVPSRGGVSHHPDEYTSPEELDRGVAVLAGTLARLAA
jgi:hydantoinase/carbamoylase family amidase